MHKQFRSRRRAGALALVVVALGGCATNPVTGQSEMGFVSEAEEIRIGQAQYAPSQQGEGGPYQLDPGLTQYVRHIGENLARLSERPQLPFEFVVLDNSVPNAWALPGGKIALNRGLLHQLEDESQLAAVLGHEIVHATARHGAQQQEKGTLMNIGLAVLGVATTGTAYQDIAMQGAQVGGALAMTRYGREAELEADSFGMQYMARAGYNPQGAVRLQEIFVRLAQGKEQGGFAALFASHPPSQERVDRNRRTAQNLPAGGRDGRAEFLQATAQLRKDKPAYDTHAKALAAYNAKNYAEALKLGKQAIALQPRQSQFHELVGMAHARLDHPADAVKSLNRAVALNQSYYRPHLLRGMLHLGRNNLDIAKQDLEIANRLLPTAEATFALGEIAGKEGDTEGALRYYRQVARSKSPLAPTARDRIARLGG